MKGKRVLLLLVFTLFFVFPAANTAWTNHMESFGSAACDLSTDLTEGEINLNYGGKYRDGVVDNFNNFVNRKYPVGATQAAENTGNE